MREYFGFKPVAASHVTNRPEKVHPKLAELVLARHKDQSKPVAWEEVQRQLGL